MKVLLDTHVLFWWLADDDRLSTTARRVLGIHADEVHVSTATVWEIAIKVGQGKWPEARDLLDNFDQEIANEGFWLLPVAAAHARMAGLMQSAHRDPFDRMLAAQALCEGLTLVSADAALASLGASCVW